MTDVKSFLAIVNNVYPTNTSFLKKDKEDMDFKMSFTESIIKLNIQKRQNILKKYSFW